MFNISKCAVIPQINRNEIIKDIHTLHQGITKCLDRAKNSVHWFVISRDIERKLREFNQCRVSNKTYREPIQLVTVPSKPWETVVYQFKQSKYVVVVDCYSRCVETILIRYERSITVINVIKSIIARHGIREMSFRTT